MNTDLEICKIGNHLLSKQKQEVAMPKRSKYEEHIKTIYRMLFEEQETYQKVCDFLNEHSANIDATPKGIHSFVYRRQAPKKRKVKIHPSHLTNTDPLPEETTTELETETEKQPERFSILDKLSNTTEADEERLEEEYDYESINPADLSINDVMFKDKKGSVKVKKKKL